MIPSPPSIQGMQSIKVCGYNILTSTKNGDFNFLSSYEDELIKNSGSYVFWKHRRENIFHSFHDCDVVGLCESTKHTIKDITDNVKTLTCVNFTQKPQETGLWDGSSILINVEKVKSIHTVSYQLQEDMAQMVSGCLLEEKKSEKRFWFFVLHLKSDGSKWHGSLESIRVRQTELFLNRCKKLKPSNLPIVVVGDLNSDRNMHDSFETQGRLHVLSAFRNHGFKNTLPTQTTYNHFRQAMFDYILVKGNLKCISSFIPTLTTKKACPNKDQGSDHLPVYATLEVL